LIFYLSAQSHPPTPWTFPFADKTAHFLLYAVLAVFVFRGFRTLHQRHMSKHYIIWAVLFCLVYAATDEWHQSFVENRVPDIWDWAADAVGAAAGGYAYLIYRRIRERIWR
jgi:VanZ family protein